MALPDIYTQSLYIPGDLWINPTIGVTVNVTNYPDNITGDLVGEITAPINVYYIPIRLQLIIDKYGDKVVDHRDIFCDFGMNLKVITETDIARELFWGKNRIDSSGNVHLPGEDSKNIALPTTTYRVLFIPRAVAYGAAGQKALNWCIYIPRAQIYPVDESDILLGNVETPLELDIFATPKEAEVTRRKTRLAYKGNLAGLVVF